MAANSYTIHITQLYSMIYSSLLFIQLFSTKITSRFLKKIAEISILKSYYRTLLERQFVSIFFSIGILNVIIKPKFAFILIFMEELLSLLEPADTVFQKREMGYRRAIPVLDSVKSCIAKYRTDEQFQAIWQKVEDLIPESVEVSQAARLRRTPAILDDFVIEGTIGERKEEADEMKTCLFETIDVTLQEFDARFAENNDILLALANSQSMELDALKPLEKLGIKLPAKHEMETAKVYMDKQCEEWEKNAPKNKKGEPERFNFLSKLKNEIRDAFPNVYNLYATIDTFACSTAICEASFSALAGVNIPSRLSMTNERMRNLAFLAFESERLKSISVEEVLRKFNDAKDRRVQLF